MDFYSNTTPNLLSDRIKNSIHDLSNIAKGGGDMFKKIYDKYVQPNILLIIFIILIVVFLYYRYNSKNNNEQFDKKIAFNNDEKEMIRPIFNPYKPTSLQTSYVNYLPAQIPVKVDDQFINDADDDIPINPKYTDSYIYDKGPQYRTAGEDNAGVLSDDGIIDFVNMNRENVGIYDNIMASNSF